MMQDAIEQERGAEATDLTMTMPVTHESLGFLGPRLDQSLMLHLWLATHFKAIPAPKALRSRLIYDAYALAIEHHAAIGILLRSASIPPSYTLIRPLMECSARATWALFVAQPSKISDFYIHRDTLDLDDLMRAISGSEIPEIKKLKGQYDKVKKIFHSWTHVGSHQFEYRRTGVLPAQLPINLMLADNMLLLAGNAHALDVKDDALKNFVVERGIALGLELATFHEEEVISEFGLPPPPSWPDDPDWQCLSPTK